MTLLMVLALHLIGVAKAAVDCTVSVPEYGTVEATLSSSSQTIALLSDPSQKFSATGADCTAAASGAGLKFDVFAQNESGSLLRGGYVSEVLGEAGSESNPLQVSLFPSQPGERDTAHAVYI